MPGSSVDRSSDGFFLLLDPLSDFAYRGRLGVSVAEADTFLRAEAKPAAPVPVRWWMGGASPADVVWVTSVGPLVVSPKVIQLLEAGGFTGWDRYPVEVVDKRERPVPGLVGLAVTGRCDPVDPARVEIVLREYPGGWFPLLRGVFFPLESWDGSDLFMERPLDGGRSVRVFASKRLVRMLQHERINNVRIEHTTEHEVPDGGKTMRDPRRLPPDFETQLAQAYERLGVARPAIV